MLAYLPKFGIPRGFGLGELDPSSPDYAAQLEQEYFTAGNIAANPDAGKTPVAPITFVDKSTGQATTFGPMGGSDAPPVAIVNTPASSASPKVTTNATAQASQASGGNTPVLGTTYVAPDNPYTPGSAYWNSYNATQAQNSIGTAIQAIVQANTPGAQAPKLSIDNPQFTMTDFSGGSAPVLTAGLATYLQDRLIADETPGALQQIAKGVASSQQTEGEIAYFAQEYCGIHPGAAGCDNPAGIVTSIQSQYRQFVNTQPASAYNPGAPAVSLGTGQALPYAYTKYSGVETPNFTNPSLASSPVGSAVAVNNPTNPVGSNPASAAANPVASIPVTSINATAPTATGTGGTASALAGRNNPYPPGSLLWNQFEAESAALLAIHPPAQDVAQYIAQQVQQAQQTYQQTNAPVQQTQQVPINQNTATTPNPTNSGITVNTGDSGGTDFGSFFTGLSDFVQNHMLLTVGLVGAGLYMFSGGASSGSGRGRG